tara:strand:+ start:186 stop:713 length:528 start_codon:yes stop_codon:yes gene_type:complete
MKTNNLEKYLNSFGKQVVNRAKGGLQKAKGGGTNLEKSIRFQIIKDKTGFSVQFFMNSYGTFVDKGVSGTQIKRKYKNYENKVVSTPYNYTSKQPPPGLLSKWISKKGIKGRDKKSGRFISNMSLAFIIGRSIKKKGIQGISFFQKPLMLGMKQFGKAMLGALKEDITKGLTTVK